MRIDCHQHFWSLQRGDYSWLDSSLAALYRDFGPDDLAGYLQAGKIDKTVVVQAADSLAETRFLLGIAEQTTFVAGVVGWVDMAAEGACSDLEQLAQQQKFLGIRPMLQDIADIHWMLRPELDPVYRKLIELDLSFDALVKPPHLANLQILLRRYPELRVVIDHAAKPRIAEQIFEPWAQQMAELAAGSQAHCKLSGLLTEASENAELEQLMPYMQHLLHCFGAERLMWGSDWPVLTIAADYSRWLAMAESFLAPLSAAEQADVMGGTAQRFYQLDV